MYLILKSSWQLQFDVVVTDGVVFLLQFIGDLVDVDGSESVRAVVAFPVRVWVQRFHRQHISL